MAIDKSLRQYYNFGKRVKFQGGGRDASQPDFGGKSNQGGERDYQHQVHDYTPTPPAPPTSRGKELHQGPTVKDVLNEIAADRREQGAIKSLEEAKDRADKAREEEAAKNKVINEDRERRMGLEGKTGVKDTSLDTGEGFGKVDRSKVGQFSTYGRNKMNQNLQPESFFDTGLGKVIKNIGLGIVAPQLLAGTKLGSLYSGYTTANRLSKLADTLGWSKPKEVMSTFRSNLTKPKGTTDTTTPKGDGSTGREEGIMQAQAPKNVIKENIQKFSPEQLNLLRKRYAELQQVIESGEYNGQKLNNNQLATLTQTSKQMNDFLVSEVGGMRLT